MGTREKRQESSRQKILQTIRTMKTRGLSLNLTHIGTGRRWTLSNGEQVADATAKAVIDDPNIASVGDTMFADTLAQSYRFVEAKVDGDAQEGGGP